MWELRLARQDALEEIFALYAACVRWMNEVSIHQWNDTDYLSAYPPDDYADMQRRGLLFVLEGENGALLGAVVLLPEDERWNGRPSRRAWYVHNLVTAIGASGAGKAILREAEKLAKPHGMEVMRLDCADDNTRLNAWYDSQGDVPCGTCTDSPCHGILREKLL